MEIIRYLSEDGTPLEPLPFGDEQLIIGYRALRRARLFDDRAMILQRQGRLGVYAPYRGQEAAPVAAALALRPHDWLVPSYRESAAALIHGLPLSKLILFWRTHPAGWRFPDGLRILPFYIPIASQLPQAVGIAHAARLQGEDSIALTFVGDGGTSEGVFHEALNFAAVFEAPVVFLVQNNGWAISVPTERQMGNTRIAERAASYGMPGIVADGNDLVAMWQVCLTAAARAREGQGPTLIEAPTHRVGPHTTSDDPGRYRGDEEVESWLQRDPLDRMRALLERLELWDERQETELMRELSKEFGEALATADRTPPAEPWEIVEHVFSEMTPDQRHAWEALHAKHQ